MSCLGQTNGTEQLANETEELATGHVVSNSMNCVNVKFLSMTFLENYCVYVFYFQYVTLFIESETSLYPGLSVGQTVDQLVGRSVFHNFQIGWEVSLSYFLAPIGALVFLCVRLCCLIYKL